MAILAAEGFDWQSAVTDVARSGYTLSLVNSGAASLVSGAYGKGRALQLYGNTSGLADRYARLTIPIAGSARVMCSLTMAAEYNGGNRTVGNGIIDFSQVGTATHLDFFRDNSGYLQLYRGGTLLATSPNVVFTDLATFRHIEIDATIADSGGSVVVKVDGVTEISYSGDTQNGGSATVTGVRFRGSIPGASAATSVINIDNIIIQDATGAAPFNAPLGPAIVDGRLRPASDVSVQGAPSTGSSNYATIDEDYLSAADYVAFDAGEADRYGIGNLDYSPATIYRVSAIAVTNASGAGQQARLAAHVAGNTTTGTAAAVATAGLIGLTMAEKPGGGAWSKADVDALELTFERTV